jgi:hypothetical protein
MAQAAPPARLFWQASAQSGSVRMAGGRAAERQRSRTAKDPGAKHKRAGVWAARAGKLDESACAN